MNANPEAVNPVADCKKYKHDQAIYECDVDGCTEKLLPGAAMLQHGKCVKHYCQEMGYKLPEPEKLKVPPVKEGKKTKTRLQDADRKEGRQA